jgi:hypothetical protein
MHVGGWYEGNYHKFVLGDTPPNFNLKNMILTYAKEF